MIEGEMSLIKLQEVVVEAKDYSRRAIDLHPLVDGENPQLGISGIAVLGLRRRDTAIRGAGVEGIILATSQNWVPLFAAILDRVATNRVGMRFTNGGVLIREEGAGYNFDQWRRTVGQRHGGRPFKVFLGDLRQEDMSGIKKSHF